MNWELGNPPEIINTISIMNKLHFVILYFYSPKAAITICLIEFYGTYINDTLSHKTFEPDEKKSSKKNQNKHKWLENKKPQEELKEEVSFSLGWKDAPQPQDPEFNFWVRACLLGNWLL